MMKVKRSGTQYKPVALCDHCKKEITDKQWKKSLWVFAFDANPEAAYIDMAFLHSHCVKPYTAIGDTWVAGNPSDIQAGRGTWCLLYLNRLRNPE